MYCKICGKPTCSKNRCIYCGTALRETNVAANTPNHTKKKTSSVSLEEPYVKPKNIFTEICLTLLFSYSAVICLFPLLVGHIRYEMLLTALSAIYHIMLYTIPIPMIITACLSASTSYKTNCGKGFSAFILICTLFVTTFSYYFFMQR